MNEQEIAVAKAYLDQPFEVSLETLARCNAACTFCPYPTLDRIGTKMPDELIERLIGEMSQFEKPFLFAPFKVNEPFLDVRLQDICQLFEDECPRGTLRLFSNGAPLISKHIDWVAKLTRLISLWVSLNETDPVKYQALMGIPFDRTARNLDALHQRLSEGNFPHAVMLSTVGKPNEEFKEYCFKRWPLFRAVVLKKDAWINWTDSQIIEVPDTPCWRWFELNIMATGKVSLCCMDGTGEWSIGDITNTPLLDVYNAPGWRDRRAEFWSRKRVMPCSTCTY